MTFDSKYGIRLKVCGKNSFTKRQDLSLDPTKCSFQESCLKQLKYSNPKYSQQFIKGMQVRNKTEFTELKTKR